MYSSASGSNVKYEIVSDRNRALREQGVAVTPSNVGGKATVAFTSPGVFGCTSAIGNLVGPAPVGQVQVSNSIFPRQINLGNSASMMIMPRFYMTFFPTLPSVIFADARGHCVFSLLSRRPHE
jgi:hypothetical protein